MLGVAREVTEEVTEDGYVAPRRGGPRVLHGQRCDGLGALIQYGTGGHINHCVMALRFDGELYIVESTDGGIQRSPVLVK